MGRGRDYKHIQRRLILSKQGRQYPPTSRKKQREEEMPAGEKRKTSQVEDDRKGADTLKKDGSLGKMIMN